MSKPTCARLAELSESLFVDYNYTSVLNDRSPVSEGLCQIEIEPETKTETRPSAPSLAEEEDGCQFLEKLPQEIRRAIYKLLFSRPVPILPGPVHLRKYHDVPPTGGAEGAPLFRALFGMTAYAYQWNPNYDHLQRDTDDQCNLPSISDKKRQYIRINWITKPTPQQLRVIESTTKAGDHLRWDRNLKFLYPGPKKGEEELDDIQEVRNTTPKVYLRGEFPAQMVNTAIIEIPGIFGTQILRTCKQIHEEAIEFLYGNTFSFDFRAGTDWNYGLIRSRRRRNMDRAPFSNIDISDNRPGVKIQVNRNKYLTVSQFFDRQLFQGRALGEQYRIEPLAHFFNEIGEENTKRIKSVMLEGFFETYRTTSTNQPVVRVGGGFDEVILLAARTLQKLCPGLEVLSLKKGNAKQHDRNQLRLIGTVPGVGGIATVNFNPQSMLRFQPWDQEVMKTLVGRIANRMKNLHKLNLVHDFRHSFDSIQQLKGWGDALIWEDFVESRHTQRRQVDIGQIPEVLKRVEIADYLKQRDLLIKGQK